MHQALTNVDGNVFFLFSYHAGDNKQDYCVTFPVNASSYNHFLEKHWGKDKLVEDYSPVVKTIEIHRQSFSSYH